MITVQPYNLPDINLLTIKGPGVLTWRPDKTYIVLGQRDLPHTALNQEAVITDKIPVLKRPSGGHTVVLTPRTQVIAISNYGVPINLVKSFFNACNQAVIEALTMQGINDVKARGISDLAHGEQKILGSSMYRPKDQMFYHAVLNVSESPDYIARYLVHPATEPDYRKGRKHMEFITSLSSREYSFDERLFTANLKDIAIEKVFNKHSLLYF